MSALDFAHDIAQVSVTVGLPAPVTYRVLDLNARKTVVTGLTWSQAHDFIALERAADAAARFDIRTEV